MKSHMALVKGRGTYVWCFDLQILSSVRILKAAGKITNQVQLADFQKASVRIGHWT